MVRVKHALHCDSFVFWNVFISFPCAVVMEPYAFAIEGWGRGLHVFGSGRGG